MFLNCFYVFSIFLLLLFLSFLAMLCRSVFCRVYVMSGLRFVFLCFVMNPFEDLGGFCLGTE